MKMHNSSRQPTPVERSRSFSASVARRGCVHVGSIDMSATESRPRWKRILSLAIKIYAGICSCS
jgi:hypothetical protein